MKYLVVLLGLFFALNAYAVIPPYTGGPEESQVTLGSKCIDPLEGSLNVMQDIGDVVLGTARNYNPPLGVGGFEILLGDHSYDICVKYYAPTPQDPADHTILTGYWTDNHGISAVPGTYPAIITYSANHWPTTGNIMYLITKIDASHPGETVGPKHFDLQIDMWYFNL